MHPSPFCSVPPVLLGSVFSTMINKPTLIPHEKAGLEVWTWRGANDFVLQEFPYLTHRPWEAISFGVTEISQVPKQIGRSGRGSKWKKGSVCRQVLQRREKSEKKNSKIWHWGCYRVEYFPLFSKRQQLVFSLKKVTDYWAVNNVQFYLHPLFGLFWSFR